MTRFLCLCTVTLLLAGCSNNPKESGNPDNFPPQDEKLRLIVVDDQDMATAIKLLQGEWQTQTGSKLTVDQISSTEWLDGESPRADAFIFPSALLGLVATNDWLRPIHSVFESDGKDQTETEKDVFSLLRGREAVWGTQTLAVPFGSAVLTCYCRADLLERLNRPPPNTWAEYQDLALKLAEMDPSSELPLEPPSEGSPKPSSQTSSTETHSWHGALEPLADGWASQILLARAAAYATYREHNSVIFNIETMDPLIAGEPFVRALEELVDTAGFDQNEPKSLIDVIQFDPSAVRRAFWEGRAGMAISWPTAAIEENLPKKSPFPVILCELPGSEDVYDYQAQTWKKRRPKEQTHVTVLATSGRLGGISKSSKWPKASLQLLIWLSGKQSRHVSVASPSTTLFRTSHLNEPNDWVEPQIEPTIASQYAEITQTALTRPQRLFSIRIPGRNEYLEVLDRAVHQSIRGERQPSEALDWAASQWQEITNRLGRDTQKTAYHRSLGLD